MEGRHKPPKAEHPFPDRVEMWKLWGTPSSKSLVRSYLILFTGFSTFMMGWLWLRDEGRGPFGCELRSTEDLLKGWELSKFHLSSRIIPTVQAKTDPFNQITATFYDDGRQFVPPVMNNDEMLWKHLAAGAVAGAVSRTATAPLDRLKVFLQVRGAEYANLRYCFRQLLKDGGWPSLWRGNGINVLKIAPETAIKFMAYEHAKRKIRGNSIAELTIGERFMAGAFAGVVSQTVIYPMEVLKTRLVLGKTGDHRGIMHCAQKILRVEGIRGFYRGYLVNLIGIIPYAGIDLAVYETLKRSYLKSHINDEHRKLPKTEAQIHILLFCGAVSSSCGQLLSYPLALIRTRLQAATNSDRGVSISILFRQIYDKEGLRGFYRGIVPNFMKVAPAVSISYVVYERTRRALGAEMC